jgi:hypothetical protein
MDKEIKLVNKNQHVNIMGMNLIEMYIKWVKGPREVIRAEWFICH